MITTKTYLNGEDKDQYKLVLLLLKKLGLMGYIYDQIGKLYRTNMLSVIKYNKYVLPYFEAFISGKTDAKNILYHIYNGSTSSMPIKVQKMDRTLLSVSEITYKDKLTIEEKTKRLQEEVNKASMSSFYSRTKKNKILDQFKKINVEETMLIV